MTIRIYCPACRTPFEVDDSHAGEKGLCPSSQTKFTIRKAEAPPTGQTQPLARGNCMTGPNEARLASFRALSFLR